MRNSNAIFSHPRQLGSDYPLSARDGPSHSRRFNCALQLSSLFILCYLHACSRAFVWYRTAHVWGNFSKNLWFLGTFTPKVTFAFRVQILAICSKDYFWTFGELRLSQIAPPPLTACSPATKWANKFYWLRLNFFGERRRKKFDFLLAKLGSERFGSGSRFMERVAYKEL